MRGSIVEAEAPRAAERSLFLYSPVGGGHFQASCALADAWLAHRPGTIAQKIDYLQFMPAWERRLWPGLYHLSLRYWPALWRSYRKWTNRPTEPSFIHNRVTDVGADRFASLLDATRPRLVVSTIGGAAALAGSARARLPSSTEASFLNALVVTGFRAHHHWARQEADLIFVASHEAKADLMSRAIPAQRIFVIGIPISPALRPLGPFEKAGVRRRLGLGDDPVILVSSGATAAYRSFDELLRMLAEINRPLEVVTFAGPPSTDVERVGKMRLFRLGFRRDFCDWMAASDLVVGKLGDHTAAEAFATGVPIVVWKPIPGHEEENAGWVVSAGAGVWPRSRAALKQTVVDLLYRETGRLEYKRLAQTARRLARPDAAAEIARVLADALEARA